MAERVAVVGAGIAGLGAAMALAREGREIVVIDRDPPAPENVEVAFDTWERKGVTQLRHSHVFLGKTRQPDPRPPPAPAQDAARNRRARIRFRSGPAARACATNTRSRPADRDLSFLFSRRTTLEHTMRAYVLSLPGVRFITDAVVRDADRSTRPARSRRSPASRIERQGGDAGRVQGRPDHRRLRPHDGARRLAARTRHHDRRREQARRASSTSRATTACATAKKNRRAI